NLDRADGFTGITTDAKTLWPRICFDAMMKRRHDQPDSSTVNIAEHMSAHLLIRGTDIGAGRTANAAQRLLETGISSHLTAPVIDEDNMHLFTRSCRTGDKGSIARDLLRSSAAGEQ